VIELPWSDTEFAAVAGVVAERTGLVFPHARRTAVERGVREAMARSAAVDLRAYGALLARDNALLDDLVTELTIGETYFFREPKHFAFVRESLLPDVVRRRGPGHAVRAWSAGCSTGEEAYSLAILLDEAQLPERPYVLATDLSRKSLQTARSASYRVWSLRGVPATTIERYFRHEPGADGSRNSGRYDLDARLRNRVTFEYLNFALDSYPALDTGTWGMDLIFCRNVLIYLDRRTTAYVAERLRRCLATDGWIVTASSDPMLSEYTDLEPTRTDWGVFYRRTKRTPLAPAISRESGTVVATPMIVERAAPLAIAEEAEEHGVTSERLVLARAEAAMAAGAYRQAAEGLRDLLADSSASALHVRALANVEVAEAERACTAALGRHPLSVEHHYLRAVLLVALVRFDEAIRFARRIVYLDGNSAIGYFTLGGLLRRTDDLAGARRAYRNAHDLLLAQPADALVPLSDGERAGRLAELASIELEMLSDTPIRMPQ
jgi:chemotaxis protein methyltransferase CheR